MRTTYAKLTENNDWEGETWHFYIPIEGNEDALTELKDAISELDENDELYEIDCTGLTEGQVDALVKHGGDTDYMHAHNKLAGVLRLPADFREKLTGGEDDPLYKGEIREYMYEAAQADG